MNIVSFDLFQKMMGSEKWFVSILKKVKELKLEQKVITDIYIREGKAVSLGILKNMFPELISTIDPAVSSITEVEIKNIIEKSLQLRAIQSNIKTNIDNYVKSVLERNVLSFSISIEGLGVLRITYSKSVNGSVMAIRILDFKIPTIEEVKLSVDYTQFLLSLLKPLTIKVPFKDNVVTTKTVARGGLIIHCGATGSGKTTTIAAELDFLSKNIGGMIITYEDPVEYMFTGYQNILQYELHDHIKEDEIYDHFLRATAQVGLVGEVRKIENMARIVDLASRGHLIFTTMHAGSVVEALYILKEAMKDNLPLLASTLTAITHQRLELRDGSIVPVYNHLLFRETEQVSQIRKMIEENKGYQEFVNFFKNNEHPLKTQKVLITS